MAFAGAMIMLWAASDWPMHDISEEYLYSVHMIQHLLITFVVPPLLWAALPEWLARLLLSGDGSVGIWVRRLARPVAAGIMFNFMVAVSHIPWVVNTSVDNGALHYFVHLLLFASAMVMWLPVCGPIPGAADERPRPDDLPVLDVGGAHRAGRIPDLRPGCGLQRL